MARNARVAFSQVAEQGPKRRPGFQLIHNLPVFCPLKQQHPMAAVKCGLA